MEVFFLLCLFLVQGLLSENKTFTSGMNIGNRIIGGDEARASQFPYAAAIYSSYSTGTFFCGGALISNQWILTAAQCIDGALSFTIQLGSVRLDGTDANRVTVATSTYITHPDYNKDTLENNVGLIRLRLPVEFNDYMTSINLPQIVINDTAIVTAIGWGHKTDESSTLTNNLHFVELSTITNDNCKSIYGEQIFEEMICVVGELNEGTCTGDSGGPLIEYRTERAAVHVAIATFVSGHGCESTLPSGFTRTYPYVDWIRNTTQI